MKKNICLVTWYDSVNYGTCIQCYALAEYLRNKKFNVFIPDTYKYYYGINHPIQTIKNICTKLSKKKFSVEATNKELINRIEKNADFARKQTRINIISSKKEYNEIIKKCDYFISGSDQIWNPNYIKTPMLLSIAPNNKVKIAYGSSFGVDALPQKKIKLYKKYLSKYNYIGVREKTAQKILANTFNLDSKVILDPSFLLTKKDWESIAKKPNYIENNDEFIFGYFIGNNKKNENEINDFIKKDKIKMIYAVSESNIKYSFGDGIMDMDVEEFIWCLLNAKYIITDSFHAVALSINFNKNFFVYKRFSDDDKKSQNSRIYDIIDAFDLKSNMESNETTINNIKNKIDYDHVNKKLNSLRKESTNFLNEAIGGINGNNL